MSIPMRENETPEDYERRVKGANQDNYTALFNALNVSKGLHNTSLTPEEEAVYNIWKEYHGRTDDDTYDTQGHFRKYIASSLGMGANAGAQEAATLASQQRMSELTAQMEANKAAKGKYNAATKSGKEAYRPVDELARLEIAGLVGNNFEGLNNLEPMNEGETPEEYYVRAAVKAREYVQPYEPYVPGSGESKTYNTLEEAARAARGSFTYTQETEPGAMGGGGTRTLGPAYVDPNSEMGKRIASIYAMTPGEPNQPNPPGSVDPNVAQYPEFAKPTNAGFGPGSVHYEEAKGTDPYKYYDPFGTADIGGA